MGDEKKFYLCGVGANFMDMIAYAERLPKPGETIKGVDFQTGFGGKCANQCVAAARLSEKGKIAFIGKVGDDVYGKQYIEHFKSEGINIDCVRAESIQGVAPIFVGNNDAQNMIIIIPGASGLVSSDFVKEVGEETIKASRVLVCQCEIPLESTLTALQLTKKYGVFSIFNAAPATPNLPREIISLPDILCLNESEAEIVSGKSPISNVEEAKEAIEILKNDFGAQNVIITLGALGSLIWIKDSGEFIYEPAKKVKAVDTTGAGDCFVRVGTLAYSIAKGDTLAIAMKKATLSATESVLKKGTQSSFPYSIPSS